MSEDTTHLEELSTKERIKLVNGDSVRQGIQIFVAFVLIFVTIGYLGYYALVLSDAEFKLALAEDMRVLVIMGVGSALAIFGLGRTVGRKK